MKKILIGKADIKTLLEDDYIYVDKTEYIYNLVSNPDCYFLSRPRRFGKSLLISTLFEIFSGNKELFKECWIYKNTNYDWKKYPIIHLDFAKVPNENSDIFKQGLINKFLAMAKLYEINLIESKEIRELVEDLLIKLYEKYDKKVVILIDEYDKPILDNIDNLEVSKENRKNMYDMYDVMKGSSKYIYFQFVTGITRFAKTSLFSGPNNLNIISMDYNYSCLLGYTQKELEFYFSDYLNITLKSADINSSTKEDLLIEIKKWYNGYIFTESKNNITAVYNPFSILNFFRNKKFSNYWFESGTPTYLMKLLNKYMYDVPENENNITLKISELEKFEVENINLLSLLVQAGYLTIDSYDSETQIIKLRYPNKEVRDSFIDNIEHIIVIKKKIKEEGPKLRSFIIEENWEKAFILLKSIFASIPYGFKPNTEYYYSSVFMGILSGAGFEFDSEVHTNDGRIDMVLYANGKIYIIEFKIKQLPSKAINQIEDKKYFTKYLAKEKPILFMGVNFDTDEKNLSNWKIEEFNK